MGFSVLTSVYKNDSPAFFKEAMDSLLNQTLLPDEIILVRDGPVPPELQEVVDGYVKDNALFHYIPLQKNGGLGNALNIGLREAKHELVARMDSDDICRPDRFERQIKFYEEHPEVSVCGGQIMEFIHSPAEPVGKRSVPRSNEEIRRFLQSRNPFNHMTVMFKKSEVMKAGSYIELHLVEDYYLWCRMFLQGAVFGNLDEVLVDARIGADMYRRRGGYKYFKSWLALEKFKRQNGITGMIRFLRTIIMRFIVQVLMPNRLRGWVLLQTRRTTPPCAEGEEKR